MCEKCVRKSKRLGLPHWMTFGQVKALAQRFRRGESIPLFSDRRVNVAIEAHMHRIERKLTSKKRRESS